MDLNYCCADLERLAHPKESGLGLMIVIRSRQDPMFILEYRKDWQVPVAEAGIRIKFCPYCGSELKGLFKSQAEKVSPP
jgi:hypothetical protein